ncbi:hypothetical protein C8N24_0311 [Solirubrobacter pauli]|uniref:Uncharacterized protein n=1 Tax=Solirubrobacter pauli TaxID=166793 RepID=A0A660L814_9ACTN|nr:hypothetical protein C8N24_0311 [Solirubrobacter pauli]
MDVASLASAVTVLVLAVTLARAWKVFDLLIRVFERQARARDEDR